MPTPSPARWCALLSTAALMGLAGCAGPSKAGQIETYCSDIDQVAGDYFSRILEEEDAINDGTPYTESEQAAFQAEWVGLLDEIAAEASAFTAHLDGSTRTDVRPEAAQELADAAHGFARAIEQKTGPFDGDRLVDAVAEIAGQCEAAGVAMPGTTP